MDNPYETPGGADRGAALQALNGPSIMLIATGAIGVLLGLYGLVAGGSTAGMEQILNDPNFEQYRGLLETTQKGGRFANVLPLLAGAFTIFGALKMRKLEGYGLAMAASIVAMLPCVGPCCCIGLPAGIWAIVTLNKPEVKAAFR